LSEHDEQAALIQFCAINSVHIPELELLYAIPNGAKLPWRKDKSGHRYSKEAIKLKAEGLKPGIPDLMLPVARGGYHGFYLEMKYGRNSPEAHQLEMMDKLRLQGYLVLVFYSWQNAAKELLVYMERKDLLSQFFD
jgi:hypothetical protein